MELLYIADKYCVDKLAKSCMKFLNDNISPDTICLILEALHEHDESKMYEQALFFMKNHFTESIKSKDFSILSLKCLKDVMAMENFVVKEEELYENLMRWADSECQRQKLDISGENKRKVLGDILNKVRFPLMDPEYFALEVARTGLLSDAEKVDVFLYYTSKKSIVPQYFQEKERILKVMRFGQVSSRKAVDMEYVELNFTVSHDSWLHGILVYGCKSGSCEYSVDLKIIRQPGNRNILRYVKIKLQTSSEPKVYAIMFQSSLHLKTNQRYFVSLEMTGSAKTYRGENEKEHVSFGGGKSIYFCNKPNEKRPCDWQIPGFLLT